MNILQSIFKRKNSDRAAGSGYRFFFGQSASGTHVNERTAMQMTAVYACVRVLAESVASLPLHLYRRGTAGNRVRRAVVRAGIPELPPSGILLHAPLRRAHRPSAQPPAVHRGVVRYPRAALLALSCNCDPREDKARQPGDIQSGTTGQDRSEDWERENLQAV